MLSSVNAGLARARDEYNERAEIKSGQHPAYEYGIIVCGMRSFDESASQYYKEFLRVHQFETPQRLRALASMALITVLIKFFLPHFMLASSYDSSLSCQYLWHVIIRSFVVVILVGLPLCT